MVVVVVKGGGFLWRQALLSRSPWSLKITVYLAGTRRCGVGGGGKGRGIFVETGTSFYIFFSTFYHPPIFVCFKNHGWRLYAGNDVPVRVLKNTRLACSNLAGPQSAFLGIRLHLHLALQSKTQKNELAML